MQDEWDTRSSDTLYRLPRAVEIGLVLIAPSPDDSDRTIDIPFLSTVNLTYGGRLLNKNNPMANRGNQSLFGGNGNPMIASPLLAYQNGFSGFGSGALVQQGRANSRNQGGASGRGNVAAGSPLRGGDGKVRANPRAALMGGRGAER